MKISRSATLALLAAACLGLFAVSAASAQTTTAGIRSDVLTAQVTSPVLLLPPYVSTVHVVESETMGDGTTTVSSPSQKRSMLGIPIFDVAGSINTTHACRTNGCNEVDTHVTTGLVSLLGGLIELQAIDDTLELNLATLEVSATVTVVNPRIAGQYVGDISVQRSPASGNGSSHVEYPVHGPVTRTFLNVLGIVITEQLTFDGLLDIGNEPTSLGGTSPGDTAHYSALSLKGTLSGGLSGPYGIDIELGDVHVVSTGAP